MFRSNLLQPPLKNAYVFVRHGQTTANAAQVYAGDTDVPLTEKGQQQAAELSAALPAHISVVRCSPLQRALDTAAIALKPHRIEREQVVVDDRLKEKAGGAISGMAYDEIAQKYPEEWDRDNTPFAKAIAAAFPGGESDLDVVKRLEQVLAELEAQYKGATILIVSHAGIMLAARYLLGKSEQEVFGDIPSCGIDQY